MVPGGVHGDEERIEDEDIALLCRGYSGANTPSVNGVY
jgi:hypothetical protein